MRDESKYPSVPDQNELTTASERETLKRAMLHWLDRKLEYAPRSQIRDITQDFARKAPSFRAGM